MVSTWGEEGGGGEFERLVPEVEEWLREPTGWSSYFWGVGGVGTKRPGPPGPPLVPEEAKICLCR